jgi:hypothetical protein
MNDTHQDSPEEGQNQGPAPNFGEQVDEQIREMKPAKAPAILEPASAEPPHLSEEPIEIWRVQSVQEPPECGFRGKSPANPR